MKLHDYEQGLSDMQRHAMAKMVRHWGEQYVYPRQPNYIVRSPAASTEKRIPEMSAVEHAMYSVNPDPEDHEWRKQYFQLMPQYLSRYFAERYIKTFNRQGRRSANTYLRKTLGEKITPRLQKVLQQYPRQVKFRQSYRHRNDLFREKSLAEMDKNEIKKLAQQFADYFSSQLDELVSFQRNDEQSYESSVIKTFCILRTACHEFGFIPPYNIDKDKLHPTEAECGILRLISHRAWENKLKTKRAIMREHLAIAVGQVQKSASPYCSRDCVNEWKAQKQRNRDFIKGMSVFDEDTEEELPLSDLVYKSVANPAIRRAELMVRMRGFENIANAMDCEGLFFTLTAPSKFHNARKKGGFVENWMGNSPREAQHYLCAVWARIRAQLKRENRQVFGFRVVEPHHDGTPHWHLLLFMSPLDIARIREIFICHAIKEDVEELFPSGCKASIAGPFDYRARCDVKRIDPSRGSATGYIAKYISKNIDGYAMEDERDVETGREQSEMSAHVTAWASRWRIRQFQSIGGAPVTTYRELRRYANNDVNTFKSYVAMLNTQEQSRLFAEMFPDQDPQFVGPHQDFVGPRLNYSAMDARQRWEVMTGKYKPKLNTDTKVASVAMMCADRGDWAGYVMAQGGPFVSRKDLLIKNNYEGVIQGNEYGELVTRLQGFIVNGDVPVKTRIRNWKIQPKSQVLLESEAITSSPAGASRSSVNNCTHPSYGRLSSSVRALLDYRGINLEEPIITALERGAYVKFDDQLIKLKGNYFAEGKYFPAELIDSCDHQSNWSGWID